MPTDNDFADLLKGAQAIAEYIGEYYRTHSLQAQHKANPRLEDWRCLVQPQIKNPCSLSWRGWGCVDDPAPTRHRSPPTAAGRLPRATLAMGRNMGDAVAAMGDDEDIYFALKNMADRYDRALTLIQSYVRGMQEEHLAIRLVMGAGAWVSGWRRQRQSSGPKLDHQGEAGRSNALCADRRFATQTRAAVTMVLYLHNTASGHLLPKPRAGLASNAVCRQKCSHQRHPENGALRLPPLRASQAAAATSATPTISESSTPKVVNCSKRFRN